MKLQFKHQKFQADAANAVCDVFKGQRLYSATYLIDQGISSIGQAEFDETNIGIRNHVIEVSESDIAANLRTVQKQQMLRPDDIIKSYTVELEDPITNKKFHRPIKYNFTIEMETGVGKTYTYIKTMYELNARYGWSKFIIIVPSVAIREGVYKSFEITKDHFMQEYGRQIRYFIYAVVQADNFVKFDLIGKIVDETGLTRRALVSILKGISKDKFALFSQNPEEFIIKVSRIINEQKATAIVQYIEYTLLDDTYDSTIFTEPTLKGRLGSNAIPLQKHLYDYLIYDSETESKFAVSLDKDSAVTVFVKLPKSFYINTPVGNYSPDWAIAFREGSVKHIYFVAETKGSMSSLELRKIEEAKIACARKHFAKIGAELVMYDKIDSYETLLNKVMR